MISMINYPSDSPKEFYGGSSPEGRFYFPSRYRRNSKKEKTTSPISEQLPEDREMLRKLSETMWTGLLQKKIIEKLHEHSSPSP